MSACHTRLVLFLVFSLLLFPFPRVSAPFGFAFCRGRRLLRVLADVRGQTFVTSREFLSSRSCLTCRPSLKSLQLYLRDPGLLPTSPRAAGSEQVAQERE